MDIHLKGYLASYSGVDVYPYQEEPMNKRRIVIGIILVGILTGLTIILIPQLTQPEQVPTASYWPTQEWRTSTPEEQGFDSVKLAEMLEAIQERTMAIDSLLIIRNGNVLLDAYFNNPYDGSFPHDMASVTKSIMTTLIGIAAGQGKIDLDKPLISYFPDRVIANMDARKEKVTVRHLAGMVNGFQSGCMVNDPETIQSMQSGPDWVQAALDREMAQEPGKVFCYDSPGMHLLSAVLQESTGMTAFEFARQYLFEPLGIQDVSWESDPQGYTRGWGDIHFLPRDAAKIGYLWLNNGTWDGKQIVPADWVKDAVTPYIKGDDDDYGYGWWVSEDSYYASGREGQKIMVVPGLNVILITTGSGFDYDDLVPYLTASVVDTKNPLPPNPEGVARLDAALNALVKEPPSLGGGPPPDTQKVVSGKTYVFEPNSANLETLRIDFSDPAQAIMTMKLQGSEVVWPVGMQNEFLKAEDGQRQRGYWKDPQTFIIESFDVGLSTRQFNFEGDRLLIYSDGMKFEGQAASN